VKVFNGVNTKLRTTRLYAALPRTALPRARKAAALLRGPRQAAGSQAAAWPAASPRRPRAARGFAATSCVVGTHAGTYVPQLILG